MIIKNYPKLLFLPLLVSNTLSAKDAPNILWITIEDTSPQFIGCYGNKDARTPIIDQLAKEGVRFTNAFSTGTVSSPSRTCIITGVKTYKSGTGNHRSNYTVPEFIKGFPYYLQKEGYYTTNNSKTDYNVAGATEFIREAWNESSGKAGWWNRKPGQPFFAVFNFNESHQSRTMTQPFQWYLDNVINQLTVEERIGDNEFDLPPFYYDNPEMRKQFARVYNSIKLTDNKIGELLNKLEKDNLRDSTIIFFYADNGEGIPRGKTNGINLGYRVPFIIWFPEIYKHLSPWGTGGVVTDELTTFEDLAASLISLAGGEIPEHMAGRILIGENRSGPADYLILSSDRSDNGIDMIRTVTDGRYVYSRNFMPFMPELRYIRYMEIAEIKQQMRKDLKEKKLNPLQKSLFKERPAEFLFDIEKDIWETVNLADKSEYGKILKKFRKQLDAEVLGSRDIMFLPEYELGLISRTSTPYEFRLDKVKYPLKKIFKIASLSGFRGKKIAAKQIKLLGNQNRILRYWAVTGLLSQSPEILKSYFNEIIQAMDDEYPPVAITASAIAFQEFNNKLGEENMKKYSNSENMDLSLMTINYMLYMNNKQPFIGTVKTVHEKSSSNYNVKAACMDFLGSLGLVPNSIEYED